MPGRKQEIIDRIAEHAGDVASGRWVPKPETVAIIQHVLSVHYRNVTGLGDLAHAFRMQFPDDASFDPTAALEDQPTSTSRGRRGSGGTAEARGRTTGTVKCICKNRGTMPGMLRCTNCDTLQHEPCVLGQNRVLPIDPAAYSCESCRFTLSDPFVLVREELVPLGKMKDIPGMPPIVDAKGNYHARVKIEQQFYLTQQQLAACNAPTSKTRVIISCLLLEDEVQCRMHWPKNIQLRVNNMGIKPYARGVGSEMGINQRDNVLDITRMLCQGRNSVNISAVHCGTWVVRICIADRLGLEEIKPMMMRPETLEEARTRMATLLAAGGEEDLGLERVSFSLKDPLTCMRMVIPARFDDASGTQAFDLDSFLSMAEVNRKWQDPTTLKNSTVKRLRVDSYVQEVNKLMKELPAVTAFEVNAVGDWRPEGYTDGWFDVRKTDDGETLEKLTAWAQAQEGDSQDDEETLDYQAVRDEGIDVRNEAMEATSALLSAGIASGAANNANIHKTAPKRTLIPLKVTGKKRAAVEVIDLCDSD
jgi:hypothetical protein